MKTVVKKPVTKKPAGPAPQPSIMAGDASAPVGLETPGLRLHLQVGQTIPMEQHGGQKFEMLRVDYGETTLVQDGETVEAARARLQTSVFEGYKALRDEAIQTLNS